jgi:hypothetical protein
MCYLIRFALLREVGWGSGGFDVVDESVCMRHTLPTTAAFYGSMGEELSPDL